jgi:hypothetical protein
MIGTRVTLSIHATSRPLPWHIHGTVVDEAERYVVVECDDGITRSVRREEVTPCP